MRYQDGTEPNHTKRNKQPTNRNRNRTTVSQTIHRPTRNTPRKETNQYAFLAFFVVPSFFGHAAQRLGDAMAAATPHVSVVRRGLPGGLPGG